MNECPKDLKHEKVKSRCYAVQTIQIGQVERFCTRRPAGRASWSAAAEEHSPEQMFLQKTHRHFLKTQTAHQETALV